MGEIIFFVEVFIEFFKLFTNCDMIFEESVNFFDIFKTFI